MIETITSHVQFELNTGCWLFHRDGMTSSCDYPSMRIDGKTVRLSRWMLAHKLGRPLRKNVCACHRCDTPQCINPDHLFEGSHAQNTHDMRQKNRGWGGLSGEHVGQMIRDAAKRRAIVYFSGDEWELIDAARGNVTRAAFLKAAGLDAAKRKGRAT